MTAVSQRIPLYTGGVSQQADEKMALGQVKEALNCYPDVTLGMIKRPGGKFLGKLASLTANTADSAAWFSIFRDNQEKYIATISSAGVPKVWDLLTGNAATVSYPVGKQASIESYLTASDSRNIKTLTINDFTYILNSEKVVTAKAAPTFNANRQATAIVTAVDHDIEYKITIVTQSFIYTAPSSGSGKLTLDEVMEGILNSITSGYATKTIIDNTIYLTFNTATTVTGEAGPTGKDLRVFQDSVNSFTSLPEQAPNGQVVKINNTSASSDDFYLKYVQTSSGTTCTYSQSGTTVTVTAPAAHGLSNNDLVNVNITSGTAISGTYKVSVSSSTVFTYTAATSLTTSGNLSLSSTNVTGYWEETVSPSVSLGINEQTMPIVLIRTSVSPLTFRATFLDATTYLDGSDVTSPVDPTKFVLQWEPRLVGDDDSNSHPTFVDNTIQDIFLFQNRLGFLTEDNVSMSQAGDYYNFYHKSATVLGVADPIDLSCASVKPAVIRSVTPITQGLLLFSDSQQFLMESENGPWTATDVTIRTIANYECDRYLKPVDLGSTVLYTSRNQSWTRAFEIFTRGQRENPSVNESSKLVPEWIPRTITHTTGSPQNGLWVGSGNTSKTMYLFRFFEQGDERALASWVKWVLPANVIHTDIQNDILYVLCSDSTGYSVLQHNLVLSPTTGGLINSLGNTVDPHIDFWSEVTDATIVNPTAPTAPTYDQDTRLTKVYLPTYFDTTKTIRFVVGLQKTGSPGTASGYTNVVTVETDGGGDYFTIPWNVSNNYIYVGYEYNMEITLPRYYYSLGEAGVDFTAVTTTSRMAFYTGLGGDVYFSVLDRGRADWRSIDGARISDFYISDTSPFRDSYVYKVPIYQRPDNYTMKVTSNTPFPVSLVAMQWEGQYSPGFFRRT